uniref:Uncharacterized protein n=1 Tax=Timema bartmani TaxID=61472 RepID=A0A7R9EQA9_9NEOP|nr:unnamed protein product [Timema bartmani]
MNLGNLIVRFPDTKNDESYASNYEDEIVKTEMIYNAYPGKMESASYHYTQENKFQLIVRFPDTKNVISSKNKINLLCQEDTLAHMQEERYVKLKTVLSMLSMEDIVLHMEKVGNVKPKTVLSILSMEDIVFHMEEEDIALHMEEVGNVKPRIVLNMLRKEDIVWHMEEIKLEEQSSSSSEILKSKLFIEANSDSNIEFVKGNQELSFNVLHEKEYCIPMLGTHLFEFISTQRPDVSRRDKQGKQCLPLLEDKLAKKMKRLVRANDSPMHKRLPMPNGIIQSSLTNFPSVSRNLCGLNTSRSPQCSLSCMRVHKLGISRTSVTLHDPVDTLMK